VRHTSFIRTAFLFALIFCLGVPSAFAQQPPSEFSPELSATLEKLRRAALTSDYGYRQAERLTNKIGPRLSGSPQAQRATEHLAAELKRVGFDVRLEKVMVPHWVRGAETGELVEYPERPSQTTQKIVLTALGGSVATPNDGLTAEVVVAESFERLKTLGRENVAGKIVVFTSRFDERLATQGQASEAYRLVSPYRTQGPSEAARLGAVAALNASAGGGGNRLPHTGSVVYAPDAPKIPAAALAAEDAELIAGLAKQGKVVLRLTLTPQTLPDVESCNVIADLKGSEFPEQIVIVSGHLDSWDLGTGALDDAAGLTAALGAVHAVKELGLKPRRTIRFIAWMNEENGVAGGRAYAADHQSNIANHVAAIEADSGAGRPFGVTALAGDPAVAMLHPLTQILKPMDAGVIHATARIGATDLQPLAALGVPIFSPLQDMRTYFTYHHTAADTFDKINPHELAQCAAVLAVLAYAIADMPDRLPRNERNDAKR
jgi:carboxypeptidase Q